jgi:hypothetical protein
MTDAFYCSYCARRQHDVRKLIAGPGPRLFICDACVDLCHEIVHPPADKKPARFLTGYQPGSYGCHEAMHMAFVLQELVARQLLEHRAITSRPEWAKLAQTAFDTLFDLSGDRPRAPRRVTRRVWGARPGHRLWGPTQ